MAKSIKVGNAVLCEYVAQGANNKPILIHVYSGDIITAVMPATIGLGMFIEIAADQKIKKAALELKLDETVLLSAEMMMDDVARGKSGVVLIPQVTVKIERDGILSVALTASGFARTVVIRKKVSKGAIPGVIVPTA